jgi:biotin carboxylase
MMTQDWFVLVESNTTGTGRQFVQSARTLNYRPIVLAENPARYPYIKHDAVEFVQCNTGDQDELRKVIDKLARDAKVAGIYSSSEYFIEAAAKLAQKCGLPGADPDAIRVCRNKAMQRESLQKSGLKVPAFQQVSSASEVTDALCNIHVPVVV